MRCNLQSGISRTTRNSLDEVPPAGLIFHRRHEGVATRLPGTTDQIDDDRLPVCVLLQDGSAIRIGVRHGLSPVPKAGCGILFLKMRHEQPIRLPRRVGVPDKRPFPMFI
jgi:hypothetical protein